jgi:hypothetical protein
MRGMKSAFYYIAPKIFFKEFLKWVSQFPAAHMARKPGEVGAVKIFLGKWGVLWYF